MPHPFQPRFVRSTIPVTAGLLVPAVLAVGSEVDVSELPPPHSGRIEFNRDIKPILDEHCLRCHGPERPKSGYRLDNRESALAGGDLGIDILPGFSADSPLIHYVARMVPDMGMPPQGKGEPLRPYEIALLRAWIDQGVDYGGADHPEPTHLSFEITTAVGYVGVNGNANKFRQNSGWNDGWSGGVTEFKATGPIDGRTDFSLQGRIVGGQDDARLQFQIHRENWWAVSGGFVTQREWDNNTGGYYPAFSPPVYQLDDELSLEAGRAWLDLTLDRNDWPAMRLGYEYQFRDGNRSTLQWGPVSAPIRNIYPATQQVDEHTHILKFDVAKEVGGWELENDFRIEWHEQDDTYRNDLAFNSAKTGPEKYTVVNEGYDHTQGANAVTAQKWIREWFMIGGGYLYSWINGNGSFDQGSYLTDTAAIPPTTGLSGFGLFADRFWNSTGIVVNQNANVGSLSTRLGPWRETLLYGGVQGDWTQQSGFSDVTRRYGSPTAPAGRALSWSDIDRQVFEERAGLRYTGIPYSSIYAEGRWQQENVGQSEYGSLNGIAGPDRGTDASADLDQYRFGLSTSPWRSILLTAHYQIATKDNSYTPTDDDQSNGPAGNGYPNFISGRTTEADEVEVGLVTRLSGNLKATWKYNYEDAAFTTTTRALANGTPAGTVDAGNQNANIFSVGLQWNPWRRFGFNVTGAYADTDLTTYAGGSPAVVPYSGDVWSVISSGLWTIDERTDLDIAYAWSAADYEQNNFADGLPLGIRYQWQQVRAGIRRRLTESLSVSAIYLFQLYDEPTSDGFNDYTANGFFASLTWRWTD